MTRLNARLPIVAFLILLGCPLPTLAGQSNDICCICTSPFLPTPYCGGLLGFCVGTPTETCAFSNDCAICDPSFDPCDDGDPCTRDEFDPSGLDCVHHNACDDRNICTADLCEPVTGECSNPPHPFDGCFQSDDAKLLIVQSEDHDRDRLKWIWQSPTTPATALTVRNASSYWHRLCLYAGTASAVVSLGDEIDLFEPPYSRKVSDNGFLIRDDGGPDGITKFRARASDDRTTIQVAGRGVHLPNFDLPIGNRYPVTVQLHSATQACWQSTFEESDLRNDHPGLLRAHSH